MSVQNITGYSPVSGERFIFDANIWFYMFYSDIDNESERGETYNHFLEKCEENGNPIYLPYVTISEFANRWQRNYYQGLLSRSVYAYSDFKSHRASAEGKRKAKYIEITLRQIIRLSNVVLLSDDFSALDTDQIISFKNADINDNLIVALAERNHLTVVTHDADFKAYAGRVSILTANERLLSPI